jgi:TRAP-type C4-dicarboxylate transport system substrate-binding protein
MQATSYQHLYQFKPFCDMINQRSKGRLTVELFAPGAIVDAYEQFAAAQKGAIEVGMGIGGYNIKQVPEGDIEQGLPGTFATTDDFFDFYFNYKGGEFYRILDDAYREKGCHLLQSLGPYNNVVISRQPIRTLDELKGKKIRSSGAYVDLVSSLGGVPVQLAPAEVFMALQTGTVDGSLFPNYTIATMRLWDVAKGLLTPEFGQAAGNIYVSSKAWEALPDDLKEIVESAASEASYTYAAAVRERTNTLLDMAQKQYSVQITKLSDADFARLRAAADPILQKAAALSPRAAKLVALIKEYIVQKK